jgi:hypothetical protein
MALTDKYISQSTAIAARVLGDEAVIMSTADSAVFMLNPTATVIWKAADGTRPLSRIIEQDVCSEFDVTVEEASADATSLVEELSGHGLLLLSDEPIPQKETP